VRLVGPQLLDEVAAERALAAFRISCPVATRRTDASGLTQPADWAGPCTAAQSIAPGRAAWFFQTHFDWVQVGDGKAFATGYYEPEVQASPVQTPRYSVPIYRTPPDLVKCTRPDGTTGRGRIDQTGTCVAYYSRAEIEDGALAGKGLELAWAADPVDLFFAEIQGSAHLAYPDGTGIHVGYAEQNGRAYTAIGKLLRDRGLLPPGGASMQSIRAWIAANPDAGRALMRENESYIFFRVLTGGPLGALNVPITPRGTVAADPKFVPLGAPILMTVDRPEATGIWVAQDTGGAIKGANRFDTYWGPGPDATRIAGGMSASGTALLLLPKGAAARALAQP
jgi:membrane-bound lytic murein transglycosylase A